MSRRADEAHSSINGFSAKHALKIETYREELNGHVNSIHTILFDLFDVYLSGDIDVC